ncbi:MAG: 50S ribosomal protein L17 [bacterium]
MRHSNKNRKFGRERKVRNTFLKGLTLDLIRHGKITTTEARAKELRKIVEPLVTLAKNENVASQRLAVSRLLNRKDEAKKLFEEIAPNYKGRKGGYTRITRMPVRKSDASRMAVIEFV